MSWSPAPAAPSSMTKSSRFSAWDVLRVAPSVVRSFEAGPKGLDVICIGGRKPEGPDGEKVEGFWD